MLKNSTFKRISFFQIFPSNYSCQIFKIKISFHSNLHFNMSSRFLATASTSFNFEQSTHEPNVSVESPGLRVCPFEADHENETTFTGESPVLSDRPFESNEQEQGAGAKRDVRKTNMEFYHHVRKHVKLNKIPFQRSPKLISVVKECLKTWFKTDSLTKQQKSYAENFAIKVPYWYKKAKSDKQLFHYHEGMFFIKLLGDIHN